jgi:hypothetical protein
LYIPVLSIASPVYAAINTCYEQTSKNDSSRDLYEETQCNSTVASISLYDTSIESCDITASGTRLNSTTYLNTTYTPYVHAYGQTIYAKVVDCVYNGYSQFPKSNNNSASITSTQTKEASYTFSFEVEAPASATSHPDLCGYNWYTLFTTQFSGCYVSVTTRCDSHEDIGYPGIYVQVYVEIYDGSSLTVEPCSYYNATIKSWITTEFDNIEVEDMSCTMTDYSTTKSFGHMHSINFVGFIICWFVILSMYIF